MKITWEDEAAADQQYQIRIAEEAQEALAAKEAADLIDYDALGIPEPLAIVVNGWVGAVAPRMPRIAAIGNGIFVRVGDGRKRRRA